MSPRAVAIPPGGFRRIAVLRLSSLGDVILTLPVVRALRAAYPGARIDFWVKEEFRDVVRFQPEIDHVRALERDARRVEDLVSMSAELEDRDLVVDLHGNVRTRRERWVRARWTRPRPAPPALERYAAALRPVSVEVVGVPAVEVGPEAEAWAAAWELDGDATPGAGAAPRAALCPGARHATKRWPEEHWIELHRQLVESGVRPVVMTTAAERDMLPALAARVAGDARSRWLVEPVARIAAALSRCRTAVTCDSGLMHLAAARGLRVVALFGSTSPELGFAPAGTGHRVLCRREPCQPCTLHGLERCPKRHFRCMRELKPDAVAAAVRELLR